jgi:hypothetical protein
MTRATRRSNVEWLPENGLHGVRNFALRAQLTTLSRNAVFWRWNPVNSPNSGDVTLL